MSNPFQSIDSLLFKRIDKSDFLFYKKGQFTAYSDLIFIVLMLCLCIAASTYQDKTRFFDTIKLTLPVLTVASLSLITIMTGRPNAGANIMAIGSAILSTVGFMLRPPHIAGVSLAYFMYLDLIFTCFFCSAHLAIFILFSMLTAHSLYFFVIAGPHVSGIIQETIRTSYLEGMITLACVFFTGFFANKFMAKALSRIKEEGDKNSSQLALIKNLMNAIKLTADELNRAIELNSGLIESYSENAQNHAASVEELTSTLEQISAGTENVERQTSDQDSAINNLVDCLNTLAMSIDLTEHHSKDINSLFMSFMKLTDEGKTASEELDLINKKIMKNSMDVASVTSIIEDFFDKINLLALNASIEAARAGEFGRGFAVVADEIGKLADTSQQQLKQITGLISQNRSDVETGNATINKILMFIQNLLENFRMIQGKSLDALQEISGQKELKKTMNERALAVQQQSGMIEISMHEQKMGITDIVKAVENTNMIVQKNAENTEVLKQTSENIRKLAEDLLGKVSE